MKGLFEIDWRIKFYNPSDKSLMFQYSRSWGDSDFVIELFINNLTSLKSLSFKVDTVIDLQEDKIEGQTFIKFLPYDNSILVKMNMHQRTRGHKIYSEIIFNEIFFTTDVLLNFINQVKDKVQEELTTIQRKLEAGLKLSESIKGTKLIYKLPSTDSFIGRFNRPSIKDPNPFDDRFELEDEILDRIERNPWIDLNEDESSS